jgi:hypothetical protein
MTIQGINTAPAFFSNDEAKSASTNKTAQSFMNALLDVSGSKLPSNSVQAVAAGLSKELNFSARDEKVMDQSAKYRTIDDALAEIDKILRDLKQQK